jgi:hypothetical protein
MANVSGGQLSEIEAIESAAIARSGYFTGVVGTARTAFQGHADAQYFPHPGASTQSV